MKSYLNKKKEVADLETGEVYTIVSFVPELRDRDFVKVFKMCSERVIDDFKKHPSCLLLLFYIMNNLNIDNDRFYMHPKSVLEKIGFTKETYYNNLKLLLEKKYIFKTEFKHWYRINADYFFRGSAIRYIKESL